MLLTHAAHNDDVLQAQRHAESAELVHDLEGQLAGQGTLAACGERGGHANAPHRVGVSTSANTP